MPSECGRPSRTPAVTAPPITRTPPTTPSAIQRPRCDDLSGARLLALSGSGVAAVIAGFGAGGRDTGATAAGGGAPSTRGAVAAVGPRTTGAPGEGRGVLSERLLVVRD